MILVEHQETDAMCRHDTIEQVQAEGSSARRLSSTAVSVPHPPEKIMPNNTTTEDQDDPNLPPPTTEDDAPVDSSAAQSTKVTNAPKSQVTTNPSIKNY
jgi:hypothetical protein